MRVKIMENNDLLYVKENCEDVSPLLTENAQIQFKKENNIITGFYEYHLINLDKNELEVYIRDIDEAPEN